MDFRRDRRRASSLPTREDALMYPPDQIAFLMRMCLYGAIILSAAHAIPIIKMAWQIWMVGE
jgi:hypothetical protein